MKRYNRHERAVERKLDEIIKLLSTLQRDTKHDEERIAHLKEQYMNEKRDYDEIKLTMENSRQTTLEEFGFVFY